MARMGISPSDHFLLASIPQGLYPRLGFNVTHAHRGNGI